MKHLCETILEVITSKLLVDEETGAVEAKLPTGTTYETPEQKRVRREIVENRGTQKFFIRSECGKFFWSLYYPDEDYFSDISDSFSTLLLNIFQVLS